MPGLVGGNGLFAGSDLGRTPPDGAFASGHAGALVFPPRGSDGAPCVRGHPVVWYFLLSMANLLRAAHSLKLDSAGVAACMS